MATSTVSNFKVQVLGNLVEDGKTIAVNRTEELSEYSGISKNDIVKGFTNVLRKEKSFIGLVFIKNE